MKILAISGSLRASSINTALLRAVARIAPSSIIVEMYAGLGNLPLFNPDVQISDSPYPANLRRQLLAADAVLIASPEYAHGTTGSMKNALDWMVGCEAFVNKPVALLNASPRAVHAQAAVRETLAMMSAQIIDSACITIPLLGSDLTDTDIVHHPAISASLLNVLTSIQTSVLARHTLSDASNNS